MSQSEIVDLSMISQNFPDLLPPQIELDNFLEMIDSFFENGAEIVLLEGIDGSGKTTLAAQYVKRHPAHAISLFLKAASQYGNDPSYLRQDLCSQLYWILHGTILPPEKQPTASELKSWIYALQTRARPKPYYFVVDGLDEIATKDRHQIRAILDLLPLTLKGCKVLLSVDVNQELELPEKAIIKSYSLATFLKDQTSQYFADFNTTSEVIDELHKVCRGLPGRLASIRRIAKKSSLPLSSLVQKLSEEAPEAFELEWKFVDSNDQIQQMLLAIIAIAPHEFTASDLSRILAIDEATVQKHVTHLPFLQTNRNDFTIAYVTASFRAFAVVHTELLRKTAHEAIIADLMARPASDKTIISLPRHLKEAGKRKELLKFLTPEYFTTTINQLKSVIPLRAAATLGVNTAISEERDDEILRFSLSKSIFEDIDQKDVSRAEIEARVAVGDYTSALATAQSAVFNEDRLLLLAILARSKRTRGVPVEIALIEQIQQLFKLIKLDELGDLKTELASELIHSAPELAFELMGVAQTSESSTSSSSESESDPLLAALSVRAYAFEKESNTKAKVGDELRRRIKNPELQQFSSAVALTFGEYSANELIEEASRIKDISVRIYFLRTWCQHNRRKPDALNVVKYSIQVAVGSAEYTPNARDIREILAPLPFAMSDQRELSTDIIRMIDGLQGSFEKYGPTVAYAAIRLLVAEAEINQGIDARTRITDTFYFILYLSDQTLRTECLAHLSSFLSRVDPAGKYENSDNLHSTTEKELRDNVSLLLQQTAIHDNILRGTIRALASSNIKLATEIAHQFNCRSRRDNGCIEIVKAATSSSLELLELDAILNVLKCIDEKSARDSTVANIMVRLSTKRIAASLNLATFSRYVPYICEMLQAPGRCKSCYLAMGILARDKVTYSYDIDRLSSALEEAWEAIDIGWLKVRVAFEISAELAEHYPSLAQTYLKRAEDLKFDVRVQSSETAWALTVSLRLAISAYSGLIVSKMGDDEHLSRIDDLISQLPSHGEQARLWADLAWRHYLADDNIIGKRIVVEKVRPVFNKISLVDGAYRTIVLQDIAPVLYQASSITTLEDVRKLQPEDKDDVIQSIIAFKLHKSPLFENSEHIRGEPFHIDYDEAVEILVLLGEIETDSIIYSTLEALAVSFDPFRKTVRLTREQRSDIVDRMERLMKAKFPSKKDIQHEGFLIAATAQVLRVREARNQAWQDLAARARKLPNLSDSVYVLSLIAQALPNKESILMHSLLDEARKLAVNIPSIADRTRRLQSLAEANQRDTVWCKQVLKEAMQQTLGSKEEDHSAVQRSVVDYAHHVDEDFAATLAAMSDNDPARISKRKDMLADHIKTLKARKYLCSKQSDEQIFDERTAQQMPDIAWAALGSLNGGRAPARPLKEMRTRIVDASKLPVSQAFPILAWGIGNATKRFANTDQAKEILRPLFGAILLACQVSASLVNRSAISSINDISKGAKALEVGSGRLYGPQDRDAAVAEIKRWITDDVTEYLKICDPYFGVDDLQILQWILQIKPNIHVQILTSLAAQGTSSVSFEEAYKTQWRFSVSAIDPPDTDIVVCGTRLAGRSTFPIHDRWWVTKGSGLRLGTSINSVGLGRYSEVSKMSSEEATDKEKTMDRYLGRVERNYKGDKLIYTAFTL